MMNGFLETRLGQFLLAVGIIAAFVVAMLMGDPMV